MYHPLLDFNIISIDCIMPSIFGDQKQYRKLFDHVHVPIIKDSHNITPDPNIIMKMQNDEGKLVEVNPKKEEQKMEKEPKKKKKRLPGERMLRKLVNHKDDDAEEQKLKRIVRVIKNVDVPPPGHLFL